MSNGPVFDMLEAMCPVCRDGTSCIDRVGPLGASGGGPASKGWISNLDITWLYQTDFNLESLTYRLRL
jgi:hypothetical protein